MLLLRVPVLGQLLPKLSRGTGGGEPRGIWSPGGDVTSAYFITFSGTMSGSPGGLRFYSSMLTTQKSENRRAREAGRSWLCHLMNKYLLPTDHCARIEGTVQLLLLLRKKGKEGSETGVGKRLRCDVHWRCSHQRQQHIVRQLLQMLYWQACLGGCLHYSGSHLLVVVKV